MRLTRRKYTSIASGLGAIGLAGCLDPPETEAETETESSLADEQEDPVRQVEADDVLYSSLDDLTEFVDWKATEYESAVSSYRDGLEVVESRLEVLSEQEPSTISQSELDELFEAADNAASIDDRLGRYYERTPNLSGLARNLQTDLQRDLDRSDFDQLSTDIDSYKNAYGGLTTSPDINRRFPTDPVYGTAYELFIGAENVDEEEIQEENLEEEDIVYDPEEYNDYIFEAMVADGSDGIEDAFFVTYDETNISEDPFNYAPEGLVSSNRDLPVDELFGQLIDRSDHDIQLESRMNLIRQSLYEEYPDEYFESTNSVSISESDHVGVAVQQLADSAAAEELYEEYIETGTLDSEVEFGGYSWERVFFSDVSPTVYMHIKRHGEYVVCMDVTDVQWENRVFGEDDADLSEALEGTFLN